MQTAAEHFSHWLEAVVFKLKGAAEAFNISKLCMVPDEQSCLLPPGTICVV